MTTVARGNHKLAKPAAAIPSFMPSAIAWYKWGEGIEITGSGVSQWDDQSGNENHLLQATDSKRPALQSDHSILFDGVNDYLKTASFTLAQPETVYMLVNHITWELSESLFDGDSVNGGKLVTAGLTPNVYLYAGSAASPGTTSLILNTYAVLMAQFNGASSKLQVNKGTANTGNPGSNDMNGFTLGTRGDFLANYPDMEVKEIAIFPHAHTAAEINQMVGYLMLLGQV